MMKRPFVFFDRDDTLIFDVPYLSEPEKVVLTPGAGNTLKILREKGYGIVIVTNQSGVGRGFFSLEQMHKVNDRMIELLQLDGASVDKIYFCPHAPGEDCQCRKPKIGMLLQASMDFHVDVEKSYMVGDSKADIELGKSFGIKTVQVCLPGREKTDLKPDVKISSLPELLNYL